MVKKPLIRPLFLGGGVARIPLMNMNVFHQHPANKCPRIQIYASLEVFLFYLVQHHQQSYQGNQPYYMDILGYYKWSTSNLISMHAYCMVVLTFITAAKKTHVYQLCLLPFIDSFCRDNINVYIYTLIYISIYTNTKMYIYI